ncbi:MAG: hypothetical protein HY721_24775 [Planctomycetes bacterium]|nr:hypothetical protein [Planctomycetota bacterium]
MSKTYSTACPCLIQLLLLAGVAPAQDPPPSRIPFNRAVERAEVAEEGGRTALQILYGLTVSDPTRDRLVLDADVEVSAGGRVLDLIPVHARKEGAIECAVTCSSTCPSIFGDGVCTGCGCNYNNWLTSDLGGDGLMPGDEITVIIRPTPGAAPELDTADDRLSIVFRPARPTFLRGDSNDDGRVDIADPIALLGCLFSGTSCPSCQDAADSNDDGKLDLSDAVFALAWLFLGGPEPPDPGPHECGADPTADRLAACVYDRPGCGPVSDEAPTLADAASRLHYAAFAEPLRPDVPDDDAEPLRGTGTYGPRSPVYDPRPGPGFSWSSTTGRRLLLEVGEVAPDPEGSKTHAFDSIEHQIEVAAHEGYCVEPQHYVTAADRNFGGWSEQTFQAPGNAFATKAEATAFLSKIQAEQPFFLPFTHPDVKLGHGWYYSNGGGLHRACDYSRSGVKVNEDPTFVVRSAGAGEVVGVTWDHNAGNVVAVEHTAPDGQKVMILYLHLRSGRSNDVAKAKSSTSMSAKYVTYRAFATNFPNHLSWGTESHKLLVKVGDKLGVGDAIGYAGNTGAGGAGAGLNPDGSPESWKGNVHLHVYWAVPHPTKTDTWVWVDPYGVYDRVDTGCYDLLKNTQFSRLYAPFYPTFHGVPFEVFEYYWGYYPNMGWKLRTLSVHRKGEKLVASGSFQSGIAGGWYLQAYRTPEEIQDKFDEYWAKGYIARELSVAKSLAGQPRYTAIWRKLESGEHVEHRGNLTAAQWSANWQERVVEDGWRVEDYFGYTIGGKERISALFTSHQPRPFYLYRNRTSAEMDDIVDDNAPKGLLPVSFNVAELAEGKRYTGIFRDVNGCWKIRWGLTPSEYQSYVSEKLGQGFRVWKVQGYSDSSRYAVILQKDGGCP